MEMEDRAGSSILIAFFLTVSPIWCQANLPQEVLESIILWWSWISVVTWWAVVLGFVVSSFFFVNAPLRMMQLIYAAAMQWILRRESSCIESRLQGCGGETFWTAAIYTWTIENGRPESLSSRFNTVQFRERAPWNELRMSTQTHILYKHA